MNWRTEREQDIETENAIRELTRRPVPRDDRPEWVKRMEARENPAKELVR